MARKAHRERFALRLEVLESRVLLSGEGAGRRLPGSRPGTHADRSSSARPRSAMGTPAEIRCEGGRVRSAVPVGSPRRPSRTIGWSAGSGGWTTPGMWISTPPKPGASRRGAPRRSSPCSTPASTWSTPSWPDASGPTPARSRPTAWTTTATATSTTSTAGISPPARTTCRTTTATDRTSRGRSRRRGTTGPASSGSPGMPRSCR